MDWFDYYAIRVWSVIKFASLRYFFSSLFVLQFALNLKVKGRSITADQHFDIIKLIGFVIISLWNAFPHYGYGIAKKKKKILIINKWCGLLSVSDGVKCFVARACSNEFFYFCNEKLFPWHFISLFMCLQSRKRKKKKRVKREAAWK